jgi:hypothetical protein
MKAALLPACYTLNGYNLSFVNLGCDPSKLGWSIGVLEIIVLKCQKVL